jgi:2-(1,2-epoxy-1,2-dihydrophenyl)acetyl-CoA isomerase
MDGIVAERLATELYRALASGDRKSLDRLLHSRFSGRTTAGLPLALGGSYDSPAAMREQFWGRIGSEFAMRAEPIEFGLLEDGRLLVRGYYRGVAKLTGRELDAEFVHLLSFTGTEISELIQLTDSARWQEALTQGDFRPGGDLVELVVDGGLGVLRLNRPDTRNALNQAVADQLYEVAQRCAAERDLRALLVVGNGSAFTVGGDIRVFADAGPGELPGTLRRMAGRFNEALLVLSSLGVPIVTAVQGAVAGGGLGLVHLADIAIAAEGTKFATGFTTIGLPGDGGNSWFLPRLVGLRKAVEMYFEQRVLDAREAADCGLVTRVVPAEELVEQAEAVARRLAEGPTRAYAEIRTLLRDSWSATLPQQLAAEAGAMARAGATEDVVGAVRSFVGKTMPEFQGR